MTALTNEIRDRLFAEHFEPFTIFLSDGRQFHVPTEAHAHVHPDRRYVSIYSDVTLKCRLAADEIMRIEPDLQTSKQ